MAKYCGTISLGAVAGGGYVATTHTDQRTGGTYNSHAVPIAVELVDFTIGEKFFRRIRVCQQFVSQFIHPGDNACIYVYRQLGITNVIIGVKSSQFPSYAISFPRFLMMILAQYLIGGLYCLIPAFILFSRYRIPALLALPTIGTLTLVKAYIEMLADFSSGRPSRDGA